MIKKTKEKEEQKESNLPAEITFRFEKDKMILEVGGKKFFLSRQSAEFLFGAQIEFERAEGKIAEEGFADLNTSDFVAKYVVCSEHLVTIDKVAKFLGADETRLRRWLADSRCSDFRNNAFEQFEVKELIKKYRAEFFPEKPKEEEKAIKLNVDEVVKMLREEKTPSEMASTLGIPMDKFRFAYLKQLPEIQRVMGQPPKEEKAFDPISEDKTQVLPR